MGTRLLEKAIQSQNPPNLLLHGTMYSDRYSPIIQILTTHYELGDLQITKKQDYTYKTSKNYHELNMSQIQHSNLSSFWDTIHGIIHRNNYFNKSRLNIILLHNFNQIKDKIQCKFRVLLEKNREGTLFIFLTNNYTGIYDSLRSRFLCVRIPDTPQKLSFQTPIMLSCARLLKIYDHDFLDIRKCDIQKIKDISYNILKYNLDITEFYRELQKQCLANPKWIHKIKYRVIQEITNSQKNIKHSYRTIIHTESLLIHLYYLTSFAYYEIDGHQEEGIHILQNTATPEEHNEE